jgi:hypothetical protein
MEEEDNVNIPIRSKTQDSSNIPIRKPKPVSQKTNLQKTFDNTGGIARGFNTGYGESKYDRYLNWDAEIGDDIQKDLNEHRAREQSVLDQTGIGLARTGAKAATEIAKLPGVIVGIPMGLAADKNEGLETTFNNQWIQYFDSLDEKVKEALPVYTKEAVKNGDFFDKIFSPAFWAEDGADGAGFMLGMLAPGAIFKWAGGAGRLFGASIKAAKLAKYGEGMEAGRKALMEAGITINKIDQYMIPAFNTFAEAGAEAKGVSDDLESRKSKAYKTFQEQQLNDLKNLDLQRRSGKIDIETYTQLSAEIGSRDFESEFKEQKALAMQNTFIKNVAILAVPNYIQSKMLFGKTPSKVLLDKIGGIAEKSVKNTVKQVGKRIGQSFLSEGSEEVGQTAVQTRNTEQALRGKLGDNRIDDYNPLTFGEDFVKTLGTTEGQIAGFLGGIMGSPISVISGYIQDIANRKQTERLRNKINGESTAYQDIVKTNLYEQEDYTNPETGEVSARDKVVDGKKVFIPEAVAKVKNALDLTEQHGKIYDKAVDEGDTTTIEYLKGQAEFNLISKFIGEDQVTLDTLHEYLKVAFPTETSKDVSEEQVKTNKENVERVDKIMKKATSLQKDLSSYKDMAASIIRINNPEVTEEHLTDFMNRVANTFISERAEEFDAKDKLNKLEKQKADLLSNSTIVEIENPNYIEGLSSELDKTTETRSNNPRLDLVNKQIDKVKEQLKDFEEATNSTIWDNEYLNNKISNEVKVRQKLQKESSPEQVAKNDEVIDTISSALENATSVEDVDNAVNLTTDKHLENKIIINVEKIEELENKKTSLKDELLNIESELSEVINTNNFNLKDELDKVYQDLLIELKENRDELLQQSENLKQLKEQKQLEEANRLKKLKEKNKLEEKKKQDLSKQNKKIEEESKKIKLLEKNILLIQNIGNVVKINGVTGILNKVNDSIFEVENENEIFEINLENLENLEIEKVKSLKERYNISKISETSVTVNKVEYKINVDNLGNIISLSPKNNSSQKIKNNNLLIVVEIERNKQDFNKRTPVRNIDQRLKDNNYENIANILNTIYNYNLTDTVQSALNNLYSEKELTEQEKLQLGLWVQDAFDRLSNLFNSKNTDLENETLLNSYDNLEIILSLLYGKELKTTTKEFKNDKSNNIGKTEVDVTSERTSRQTESEKQTSKNSEIEKLNKEIEDLKSKITNLNLGTEKIIENYETSLKNTESTLISEATPIITEKLQVQAESKKAEIIKVELAEKVETIATAIQEDNDFNNVVAYDGLTATEGSIVTDELIPQENENNTSEELKSIQNSEVDHGLGVKVISTDRNTGLPLNFISEQFPLYLEYEREPVNKYGKEVGFEINQNPGKNPKVIAALNAFNNKDFSNPKLLIDFLPINVLFTNEVKAPIETRRVTNDINIATELLRTDLVNNLIKGVSINDIKTTIQDQYKGLLKVDDNRFANNNILQLDGVKDLNYIRENLYVVNSFGKLQNILNNKIFEFNNDKVKPNAAGEIYLTIPQANGKLFPLKLNIKKISENEAVLLYEIYKEVITNAKSLDTTISEVNNDLKEAILTNFEAELNIIGGNKNDIKLQEIIDLLIYQSANIKSQMQIVNGILYFGDKESTIDTIEQDQNEIIDFLVNQKRHQIKINPKSETDNTKTNLKSNSADYLKYLVDNNILSTNAVVNEPTFQGYTNIYLNTGITVNNQVQQNTQSSIEKRVEYTISEVFSSDSLFNFSENQSGKKNKKGDFIPDNLGEQIFNAINKTVKGEVVKIDKIEAEKLFKQLAKEVHPDKHINENIKIIAEQFFKAMNIAKEKGRVDILNELKLKYNVELAILNQPKVSESGVEVKTDNTGFDDLFGDKKSDKDIKKENLKNQIDKLSDDLLFITHITSNNNALNIVNSNLQMPAGVSSTTGIVNKTQLLSILNDLIDGKSPHRGYLDMFVGTIDKNTLQNNKGKSLQDKFENYLDENFIEDTAKTQLPSELNFGYFTNGELTLKINQESIRNIQENFVSLSEIPGTVENTEIKETQDKVFNEKRTPKQRQTDFRRMDVLFKKKQEGTLTSEKELRDFEMFKQMYPQEYEKRCK